MTGVRINSSYFFYPGAGGSVLLHKGLFDSYFELWGVIGILNFNDDFYRVRLTCTIIITFDGVNFPEAWGRPLLQFTGEIRCLIFHWDG